MVTLIQGGHLYGPEDLGVQDLLVINGKIERLGTRIKVPPELFPGMEVINATGRLIFPGLIDQHVHIIGGGGSGGFLTRTKEVSFRDLVKSGITTVAGTLGTDTLSRSMTTLLMKAKAMNLSGIHTLLYTGSVLFPPVTLTGSVEKDIVLISEIVGVRRAWAKRSSPGQTCGSWRTSSPKRGGPPPSAGKRASCTFIWPCRPSSGLMGSNPS